MNKKEAPAPAMSSSCQEALAADVFERFCSAGTMKQILGNYREMCNIVKLKPTNLPDFYPILKAKLQKSWKAQAIFRKLDTKYNSKIYNQGKVCPNTRVLIIGAGPCGLRSAIDAQLLGAKVVVIEKRDRMSRNNVLHLWPFVIEDLRNLGAKKFFGKFCAGAIDHISIRQLQHILLKVALLLGVELHEGVSFESLVEPQENEKCGWKAYITPLDHPVSQYEFDVLIGADGKRNTLPGFKRKEFRGKLAIAITANFINRHSKEEAIVQEISGTSFIFNQQFFKDLKDRFVIDLENIVYYKDDTHYFVMTAKKQSLLERNVLLQDYAETNKLLSRENINYTALRAYAIDAAGYSTDFKLPNLEFAVNHYGQPDVAVFDFTSMFAAENASKVLEKNSYKLLVCLVGDSLLEPFWPTGSGCARGFLSSLDSCWAIRSWGMGLHPLAVLAERESIYRILAQTTPQNLNPDIAHYSVDPITRYLALNKSAVGLHQVFNLYNTDDPNAKRNIEAIELIPQIPSKKRRRETNVHQDTLLAWFKKQLATYTTIKVENLTTSFKDGLVLCAVLNNYRPDLIDFPSLDPNNAVQNNEIAFSILGQLGIVPVMTAEEMSICDSPEMVTMNMYLSQIYHIFRGEIPAVKHKKMDSPEPEEIKTTFRMNPILDANAVNHAAMNVLNRSIENESRRKNRKSRNSSSKYTGPSIDLKEKSSNHGTKGNHNNESFNSKLKSVESQFKGGSAVTSKKPKDLLRAIGRIEATDWNLREIEKKIHENRMGKPMIHGKEKVPNWNKEQFLARQTKLVAHGAEDVQLDPKFQEIDSSLKQLDRQLKEGNVLERGERGKNKVASLAGQFAKKRPEEEAAKPTVNPSKSPVKLNITKKTEKCQMCKGEVYLVEKLCPEDGLILHKSCFKCFYCNGVLKIGSYSYDREGKYQHKVFCPQHFGQMDKFGRVPKATPLLVEKVKATEFSPSPTSDVTDDNNKLLNRDQTPERIEIQSLTDAEDQFDEMDEDEWTDRNFGNSIVMDGDASGEDDDSSIEEGECDDGEKDDSDLDSEGSDDDDDSYDYETDSSSEDDFSCEGYSSEDEGASGTWGSEQLVALERRRQEVALRAVSTTTTPTDTEVASESSSKNSEAANSATEVSTDSEFAHDDPTPTRERVPYIIFNDEHKKGLELIRSKSNLTRKNPYFNDHPSRKPHEMVGKVQVTSKMIINGNIDKKPELKGLEKPQLNNFSKIIKPTPISLVRPDDYTLSRTQSTSGIASKRALELKKKYLLGPQASLGLQKSDSASQLDSKFRAFHSNISECQKLLNPAPDISPSMQAFLENASKRNLPVGGLLSPTNMNKLPSVAADAVNTPPVSTKDTKAEPTVTETRITLTCRANNNSAKPAKEEIAPNEERKTNNVAPMPDLVQMSLKFSRVGDNNTENLTNNQNINANTVKTEVIKAHTPLVIAIEVPKITWNDVKKSETQSVTDLDSDSLLSTGTSSEDVSDVKNNTGNMSVPRVEITPCGESMQIDSLMVVNGEYIGPPESDDEKPPESPGNSTTADTNLSNNDTSENKTKPSNGKSSQALSSSDSGNDITAFFTDNDLDWAVEGGTGPYNRLNNRNKDGSNWRTVSMENILPNEHICGKIEEKETNLPKKPNLLLCDHSDIDFMDTGSEESLVEIQNNGNSRSIFNTGFIEFVDVSENSIKAESVKTPIVEAVNRFCESPVNDRSIDFIEQGACILDNDQTTPTVENNNFPKESTRKEEVEEEIQVNFESIPDYILDTESKVEPGNVDYSLVEMQSSNDTKYDNNISTDSFSSKALSMSDEVFHSKTEETENESNKKFGCNSPATSRKLQEITKEKDKQKDLIYQLVMDNVPRKTRRERRSRSPVSPQLYGTIDRNRRREDFSPEKYTPPHTELKVSTVSRKEIVSCGEFELKNDPTKNIQPNPVTKLKEESYPKPKLANPSETFSLPDIHQSVLRENKLHRHEKQDANPSKPRLLSETSMELPPYKQPCGIVPGFRQLSLNDFSGKLVQHVESLRNTSNNEPYQAAGLCMSDPNLVSPEQNYKPKSKNRDSDRRKSIIKTVSDFFSRRRDSVGHSASDDKKYKTHGTKLKTKSTDLDTSNVSRFDDIPPPIPPLPLNYGVGQSTSTFDPMNFNRPRPACIVKRDRRLSPQKRCNSLNEIQDQISKTDKYIEDIEDLRAHVKHRLRERNGSDKEPGHGPLYLDKYLENLKVQRNNHTLRARELLLDARHEELRKQLRDLLNDGQDIDHHKESAIINEMMEIVTERQAISLCKRQ